FGRSSVRAEICAIGTCRAPSSLQISSSLASRTSRTVCSFPALRMSASSRTEIAPDPRRGSVNMAQFSHPEFGGSGQWMAGGATMISDMFNNALKARVDALCNELSALIRSESDFVAAAAFQSQSHGATGNLQRG